MTNDYGLVTAAGTAKPARASVARWNDGKKRHTIYTACGTSQDGWALYNDPGTEELRQGQINLAKGVLGNPNLTTADLPADGEPYPFNIGSPDAVIARNADPELFSWVPISYPASAPGSTPSSLENNWQPSMFSMAESAKYGVEETIRQIKNTPGTFALLGMSQGAAVMTQVMKALLPGGTLAHRYNDCIAGIAFGNPCRAIGASFPGGVGAPGGGVISLPNKADPFTGGLQGVKTPDWWWEFCVPGDFFSDAPMAAVGPLITPAIQALFHTPGSLAVDAAGLSILTTLMVGGGTLLGVLMAAMVRGGVLAVAEQLTAFFGSPDMKKFFSTVAQRQRESAVGILANWVYQQVGTLDIGASLTTLSPVIVPSNYYPRGNPHILLGSDKPPALPSGKIKAYGPNPEWTINLPGIDANSTYVQIAQAYLNARGAAVTPR